MDGRDRREINKSKRPTTTTSGGGIIFNYS
jgi:hypothetical protein